MEVQRALVKQHSSFRSCDDLGEFYKDIFNDSSIASKFTFAKTKCMYTIKYGIAPYVKEKLSEKLSSSPYFRKILQDDLLTVKKKSEEENLIITLTAESDSYVEQAAAEAVGPADMKLLILKAQSFK